MEAHHYLKACVLVVYHSFSVLHVCVSGSDDQCWRCWDWLWTRCSAAEETERVQRDKWWGESRPEWYGGLMSFLWLRSTFLISRVCIGHSWGGNSNLSLFESTKTGNNKFPWSNNANHHTTIKPLESLCLPLTFLTSEHCKYSHLTFVDIFWLAWIFPVWNQTKPSSTCNTWTIFPWFNQKQMDYCSEKVLWACLHLTCLHTNQTLNPAAVCCRREHIFTIIRTKLMVYVIIYLLIATTFIQKKWQWQFILNQ